MKRKVVVGFDFDGVVAFNPFGVVRAPIKWFKKVVLNKKAVGFFVPKNGWQRLIWRIVHESSIMPAVGAARLKQMVERGDIEAHLITGRFGFLEGSLQAWLKRYDLERYFKSININRDEKQPHVYKLEMVTKLKLDVFVEDNLDVVEHLCAKSPVRVMWIYNLIDRNQPYSDKYPYLEKALEAVFKK